MVRLEHLLIVFLLLELRLWEVELRLLSLHHLQSVVNGIEVLLLVLVLCFLLGLFPFLFDLLFLIVEELLVLNQVAEDVVKINEVGPSNGLRIYGLRFILRPFAHQTCQDVVFSLLRRIQVLLRHHLGEKIRIKHHLLRVLRGQ